MVWFLSSNCNWKRKKRAFVVGRKQLFLLKRLANFLSMSVWELHENWGWWFVNGRHQRLTLYDLRAKPTQLWGNNVPFRDPKVQSHIKLRLPITGVRQIPAKCYFHVERNMSGGNWDDKNQFNHANEGQDVTFPLILLCIKCLFFAWLNKCHAWYARLSFSHRNRTVKCFKGIRCHGKHICADYANCLFKAS